MMIPLQVSFQNFAPSDFLKNKIETRLEKLQRFSQDLIACDVNISSPHRRLGRGTGYHVRIHLSVPGKDIIVSRDPGDDLEHVDAYVAVRDAFDAVERQLKRHAQLQKSHRP